MAINNVYNQTPKRIFTNKPFVKGMSYTNADMAPYVCRSVANLDMESSSTATHIRQGIYNKKVYENAEVLKFFDKYVVFNNTMTEVAYRDRANYIKQYDPNLRGIKILSEDFNNEYSIYDSIVYNDTEMIYDGTLSHSGDTLSVSANSAIINILKLNNGDIPHTINSNDNSISFFGSIILVSDSGYAISEQYIGMITIYFHTIANTAIIEILRPTITNPEDVMNYGTNVFARNPLIYRDYVSIPNEADTYLDYAGSVSDKLIDITTVQVYDTPVEPVGNTSDSTANLVNGFDKNKEGNIYVRPYVVLPKGDYSAVLKATAPGDSNNDYYYNFQNNSFIKDPTSEKLFYTEIMDGIIECDSTNKSDYINDLANSNISGSYLSGDELFKLYSTSTSYILFSDLPRKLTAPDSPYSMAIKGANINIAPVNIGSTNVTNVKDLLDYTYGSYGWYQIFSDNIAVSSSTLYYKDYEAEQIGNMGTIVPISQIKLSTMETTSEFNLSGDAPDATVDVPVNLTVKTDLFRANPIEHPNYNFQGVALGPVVNKSKVFGSNGAPMSSYSEEFTISNVASNSSLKWLDGTSISFNSNTSTYSTNMSNLGVSAYCTLTLESQRYFNGRTFYTVRVKCDVSIDWNTASTYLNDGSKNYILKCLIYYPSEYPHLTIEYTLSKPINNVMQYCISNKTLGKVTVSASINSEEIEKYLVHGYIGAICSRINPGTTYEKNISNGGIVDFANSLYPLGYIASGCKVNKDSEYNPTSVIFPAITVYEKQRKTVISDSYINHVQIASTDSSMIADYNLKVSRRSVNTINQISNSGALTFKVSVFPTTDENIIDSPDAVSATSAIIKIYEDDILKHDTLSNETNFKSGVDHVAMHLGHYVFWGKETSSNTLYYSEFNNPAYIPSMYMIDFDKPIVHVHPHQGNLVVFTTDDIHMLHSGNVPATLSQDGSEIPFTKSLIQANTRLGYANVNTVKSIGKDVFFITEQGDGYLLKTNRYVSNASDTYLIKITHQIEDLLKNPFEYCLSRADSYKYELVLSPYIDFKQPPKTWITSDITHINANNSKLFNIVSVDHNAVEVVDGDTFKYGGNIYRLADINTPELADNSKLSVNAKAVLESFLKDTSYNIYVYYRSDITDHYGRYIAWVIQTNIEGNQVSYINAEMINMGLAKLYMENEYSKSLIIGWNPISYAERIIHKAYDNAIRFNLGVHNNLKYSPIVVSQDNYNVEWDSNTYHLYTYATNNYIYIIQSVLFKDNKGMTIIYKYNIDSRTWYTYDFIGAVFPVEVMSDTTKTGFSMLCANKGKSFIDQTFSILTFSNSVMDTNEVADTINNIHAYFDTGNQGIAIMNDKLFREFKLSLGSSDHSELDIKYAIKVFIDGNEITGRDKYLKGKQETANGFKKITLLTPCRGRIPRYTVDIECESDINILEYAIVYLQLNAK